MIIFNETLIALGQKYHHRVLLLIKNELHLPIHRRRFEWGNYLYSFRIVFFEHPTTLGFYNPKGHIIGINKNIPFLLPEDQIENLLRHELAHFICFIRFGEQEEIHGNLYRDLCRSFGWGPEVYAAKLTLPAEEKIQSTSRQLEKLKKLLALSSSSNEHEAKLAIQKANQLLLEQNLQTPVDSYQDEKTWVVLSIGMQKKIDSKLRALYEILQHFLVFPLISSSQGQVQLDLHGERHHCEIAHYVGEFLLLEFDRLWAQTKKNNPQLSGITAKNSFIQGLARGFCEKISEGKKDFTSSQNRALVVQKEKLQEMVYAFHGRLSVSRSSSAHNWQACALGTEVGKNISVHRAVKNNSTTTHRLSWDH